MEFSMYLTLTNLPNCSNLSYDNHSLASSSFPSSLTTSTIIFCCIEHRSAFCKFPFWWIYYYISVMNPPENAPLCSGLNPACHVQTYLQFPLRQWGACNVYIFKHCRKPQSAKTSATTFLEKWRKVVWEIWFEKSGLRKVVDQKKGGFIP